MQNSNTFFFHQAIFSCWILALVSAGLITLLVLQYIQESTGKKRHGFNLHEI